MSENKISSEVYKCYTHAKYGKIWIITIKQGGARLNILIFILMCEVEGEGATLYPIISNVLFLVTIAYKGIPSNRQVSPF